MNDSTRYTSLAALIIVVATVLTVTRLLNATPLLSANDRSRWCTVWSLTERGTYQIDEINARDGWSTIDRVRHDGHYYSSKPPLLPRLVAYVTNAVNRVTGFSLETKPRTTTRIVLLLVNVLPTTLAWVALAWMLPRIERSTWGCLFALIVACFATLNSPFLVTFNNHSIAVWSLTLTLACMTWLTVAGSKGRWAAAAFGGLFAAWTCCNELPAAPFGLLTFLWFWRRDWKTAWLAFAPAAIIPLAAFMYTNYQVTGDWKPFYLSYGTETYEHVVDGVPSYWMRPQGLDTNPDTTPQYLFHCTLGHHGMLSLTPVFLMTVLVWLGLGANHRRKKRDSEDDESKPTTADKRSLSPQQTFGFVRHGGLFLTVFTTLFFLSKTENYNYGGNSCALRWTLWLTPLWTVGMLPVVVAFGKNRTGRVFANVLLAASLASAWYPASNPWQHPWIYTVMVRAEAIEEPKPELAPLEPTQSWVASLPSKPGTFAEFRVEGLNSRTVRMTVDNSTADRMTTVAWSIGDATERFVIDRDAFDRNAPVEDWLVSSTNPRNEALSILRGLPLARDYRPGKRAYIKVPAFDAHRSTWRMASRVFDRTTNQWWRRDIWLATDDELNGDLASEVPFGVLQMQETVTDRAGQILSRETWKLQHATRPAGTQQ